MYIYKRIKFLSSASNRRQILNKNKNKIQKNTPFVRVSQKFY